MNTKIVVYGNSDRDPKYGFPTEEDFINYIKEDIFKTFKARYHYSQTKAADIIILSRDGKAYGYFVISGTESPTPDDIEAAITCKKVYLVKESVLFERPVLLAKLGITGYQFGKPVTQEQFDEIRRMAGEKRLYLN